MSDLISREALKEDIKSQFLTVGVKRHICRIIDNAPTVEVGYLTNCVNCERVEKIRAKRPRGEWISIYPLTDKCSLCNGEALDFNDYPYKSNFCPHCGAKMKGGENQCKGPSV